MRGTPSQVQHCTGSRSVSKFSAKKLHRNPPGGAAGLRGRHCCVPVVPRRLRLSGAAVHHVEAPVDHHVFHVLLIHTPSRRPAAPRASRPTVCPSPASASTIPSHRQVQVSRRRSKHTGRRSRRQGALGGQNAAGAEMRRPGHLVFATVAGPERHEIPPSATATNLWFLLRGWRSVGRPPGRAPSAQRLGPSGQVIIAGEFWLSRSETERRSPGRSGGELRPLSQHSASGEPKGLRHTSGAGVRRVGRPLEQAMGEARRRQNFPLRSKRLAESTFSGKIRVVKKRWLRPGCVMREDGRCQGGSLSGREAG